MKFEEMELRPEVYRGIEEAGFVHCTPIQQEALPYSLDGYDVAAQAQTGTGKTATFLITIFERLLGNGFKRRPFRPRAVIIAPTRELALQIASDAAQLGKHTGLTFGTIYGGVGFDRQRHLLEHGVDIIICTPGRLIDFMRRGECRFEDVEVVVVDEADRLFDMGFYPDLRTILRKCPSKEERQMMLFSATLSFRVIDLGYEFMLDAKEISVEPTQVVALDIDEQLFHVSTPEKLPLLLGLVRSLGADKAMVFCNTKVAVDIVSNALTRAGVPAAGISGDLAQANRVKVLEQFREGKLRVLVCSDVASRGIHIDAVSHVFNYDVPQDAEDYVHRIGRTGRAGSKGVAITLACDEHVLNLPAVERYVGHKIPVGQLTDDMMATDIRGESPRRRRAPPPGGFRPSPRGRRR